MPLLIFLIVVSLIAFSSSSKNNWTGFYYPDRNNIGDESTWVIQPGLDSLEKCQDWVADKSRGNRNFDYECGYKCRYDNSLKMSVCKETLK